MLSNYTLQDIFGTTLAFLLFPLVFVFPGFVIGWLLNLFEIKHRSLWMQVGIAIVLSFSISPILIFLCWRLVSFEFTFGIFIAFFLGFGVIFWQQVKHRINKETVSKNSKFAALLAVFWITFTILSLTDMQLGNRLYYSVVSVDYTTRVSITDAVARTGVPPINPSYYPGHPEKLTSLYYFWYILTGFVDKIGGGWVDGRNAMVASAVWAGLALMATIAIYLRIRCIKNFKNPWRLAFIGMGSLAVGGLDIIPNLILLISSRFALGKFFFEGIIEHWNEQIATWLTSIFWDPHHVASLITCITSLMLLQNASSRSRKVQIAAMIIAGFALASSFGLSTWVAIVFCTFWVIWFFYILVFKKQYLLASLMALSGVIALLLAFPFIRDLFQGLGNSSSSGFPLVFNVRTFNFAIPWITAFPKLWQNIIHLLLLPFNYLLELGFFFIAAFIWLKNYKNNPPTNNLYHQAEILLLAVTFFLASFVKSTVILNNDFGWRAWLPGQFVLLIWSTEIIYPILENRKISVKNIFRIPRIIEKENALLALFLIIGLFTTILNAFYLRAWPLVINAGLTLPLALSEDTHLGERTYAAKQAYAYIGENIPANLIIQNNPLINNDRPLGLYGNHQAAIASVSAYGVPKDEYDYYVNQIKPIFFSATLTSLDTIDQICRQYFINFIVVADTDPLWPSLGIWEQQRHALYKNGYYAVFRCGSFSSSNLNNP
jgi:hypothetical protein